MNNITIPVSCDTPEKQLAYSLRYVEKLRQLHNLRGKECREGKCTLEDFKRWQTNVFEVINEEALFHQNVAKESLRSSIVWDKDIDVITVVSKREKDTGIHYKKVE